MIATQINWHSCKSVKPIRLHYNLSKSNTIDHLREFVSLPSSWPPARVGWGVRAADPATTSPAPVAPVAPVASSKNADLAAIRDTWELVTSLWNLILNNPPSLLAHKVWFWTTLHQFWRMTLGGAKSWLFEKKRPLRARQNQNLAFWEKKGPCGHAKRTPGFYFQKR